MTGTYTTARVLSAHKTTKCPSCGTWIRQGGDMYYFDRMAYCSASCLPEGITVEEKAKPHPKTPQQELDAKPTAPTTEPSVACRACGVILPISRMATMVDAAWNKSMLCPQCEWLAKAQFGLKCAGLWRPSKPPAEGAS